MHDARCGDELIGRVAPEVEAGRSDRHREVDGPYVQPGQNARDLPVLEIHPDAVELHQLRHLPRHDGGNGPSPTGEKGMLAGSKLTTKGMDQDMGVKIM